MVNRWNQLESPLDLNRRRAGELMSSIIVVRGQRTVGHHGHFRFMLFFFFFPSLLRCVLSDDVTFEDVEKKKKK